ncbi:MAG: hypothetical protein HC852_03225 [Acaryochloridaceae cyanobacterium RU_4_10]|nr:hypothetical protein [Acaryochloridaceae cyanobacterium RU_4_10]
MVTHYLDRAIGMMLEAEDGGGHFTEVRLEPVAILAVAVTENRQNNCTRKHIVVALLQTR